MRRPLDEDGRRALAKKIDALLEAEDAAYDIAAYRDAPPGLRIWCGATVDTADIEALGPWLDWAYRQATAGRLILNPSSLRPSPETRMTCPRC